MIFLFKKIVSPFLFPMPICLGLAFLGLGLVWFTQRQKAGKILITLGVTGLFLVSIQPVSQGILAPLENKYPSYRSGHSIKYIVVLGGGFSENTELPITRRLSPYAMERLLEGLRIYFENPGTQLVFTGQNVGFVMFQAAKMLGVNGADIIIEQEISKDTKDEALGVKSLIGPEPFALVTSASHLPRAMALFQKQGMNPYPAPAGHMIENSHAILFDMPEAWDLIKTEMAVHEYLGLLWAKLRGQI
jgi:uncharacterized SAM-binding protein YcdF (DUF218 family)